MSMETLQVRRLNGSLGAEVTGVRLEEADQPLIERLKYLVHQHLVIVVRDQNMDPHLQLKVGKMMGEITYTPNLVRNSDWPGEIYKIDNPGKANARTEHWHTDSAFSPRPASYTILAAQVLPPVGGDTMFTNQVAAYEKLSEPFKRMLRGTRVLFIGNNIGSDKPEEWPRAIHPLVRTIPETGKRALYLGLPGVAVQVVGMREPESMALLSFLHEHSLAIDSMYRHRWLPGDVVIWDNRTTMHAAPHDYGDAQRTMHRLMLIGEVPFEAAYAV